LSGQHEIDHTCKLQD